MRTTTPPAPPAEPTEPIPRLLRLPDLLPAWDTETTLAHQAVVSGQPRGPVTGFPALDHELGGALSPGLHIVHGGPGVGKTALALQVAVSNAGPSVFITCEMAPLELLRRHTARVTRTHLGKLRSGELGPTVTHELVVQAIHAAPQLLLVDATQAFPNPEWLAQAALVGRGPHPHLLLVVDSVHAWAESAPGEGGTEYERLNLAVAALRKLATTLHVPILGVAERNRLRMTTGGLAASAGSRKFEYGGESVWDLHRAEDAVPDGAGEVPVTLRLVKNRQGSPNRKLDLWFHGAFQRWRMAERAS